MVIAEYYLVRFHHEILSIYIYVFLVLMDDINNLVEFMKYVILVNDLTLMNPE